MLAACLGLIGLLGVIPANALAAPGDITTLAGTPLTSGFGGDTGPATQAKLAEPPVAVPTPDGGFLIPDFHNNRVRKVSALGLINTVAGNGVQGDTGDTGPATAAELNHPRGVAVTPDGGFLIAETQGERVRRVSPSGIITTVAGNGTAGYTGDNGPATSAQLASPHNVSLTADGGYLIADAANHVIRHVSPQGIITTVAGNHTAAYAGDGGPATAASIDFPEDVATTPDGGFLIADTDNQVVRQVSPGSTITTVAGDGTGHGTVVGAYGGDGGPATLAKLNLPEGVIPTVGGGFLLSDNQNNRIRQVSAAGTITTMVGNGTAGYAGDSGPAGSAELNRPEYVGITASAGLLIADHTNEVIRGVQGPVLPTLAPLSAHADRSRSKPSQASVLGAAPAGSFVAIYESPDCSGAPLGFASAASFAAPGIPVTLARRRAIPLHAVNFLPGGQLSPCSEIHPTTKIRRHPRRRVFTATGTARVRFAFRSNSLGSRFQCKLDRHRYRRCRSPKRYRLRPGRHTFRVRAIDAAGDVGQPVRFKFRVI